MIPGVILAAGASSRMGRPKALLPTNRPTETFVSRIVGTLRAADIDDVLVVVSYHVSELRAALMAESPPVRVVDNPHPEGGQLSSLLSALQLVDRPGAQAMLVTPVDVPLVSVETVRALLDAHRTTSASIVRPAHGGRHGHPVVFDRRLFAALRGADPEQGAKSVLRAHASDVLDVDVDDPGAFLDIDTPDAYRRAFGPAPPAG